MTMCDSSTAQLPKLDGGRSQHRSSILFVLNDARFFVSHRLPLAVGAIEAGYDVHLACPPSPITSKLRDIPLTVHEIPVDRRGANPVRELSTLVSLIRLYRRLRPALVHHVTIKPVIYGSIAARLAEVPAVVNAVPGRGHVFVSRGIAATFRRILVERGYKHAFGHPRLWTIFQNPDDMEAFCRSGIVDRERTVLIRGSGVDLESFVNRPEPVGSPVVVLASRMLWNKGIGEFVEAAKRIRSAGVEARFALVGDSDHGNPAAIPTQQLNAWVAEGAIEWWGRRDDMPAVLSSASIVCLPSSYGEGVPKVLLEAAACGRPIITTDSPGCREVVRHGENGYLTPVRDVDALVHTMKGLLESSDERARMGARSRAIAEAEFGVEQVVEATLSLYARLLN